MVVFGPEEGEEYEASKFGGFPDYFRRKKIKLQNLDAKLLVTCYTCHHGKAEPEVKAPHQERPQGPPPPPTGPRLNRDTTKQR